MNLIKCPEGHYYNKEKFPSCPHCANVPTFSENIAEQSEIETALPTPNAVKQIHHALRKTTGWLVCIKGTMLGENSVSRENHACIEYHSADQSFTLTTQNKDNIVMINGKKISKPVCLCDHDTITLGKCVLTFIPFCDKNFNWDH